MPFMLSPQVAGIVLERRLDCEVLSGGCPQVGRELSWPGLESLIEERGAAEPPQAPADLDDRPTQTRLAGRGSACTGGRARGTGERSSLRRASSEDEDSSSHIKTM